MSSRLKWIIEALAVVTLSVAVLAVLPGTAEAAQDVDAAPREEPATTGPAQKIVVVVPGDSLWSISQRLLPANATPRQIHNEVVRIYALNSERIGEDPDLIYPGEVLSVAPKAAPKVAPVRGSVADESGSGQPARAAGPSVSERTPKKAAAAEPSRKTAQRSSSELSHDASRASRASRVAAREPSGTPRQQPLPELPRAPLAEPPAKLSPGAASSNEERWLPQGRLLVAAVVGTVIGGGALGLILAAAFLVVRKLPTKRTTRRKHEQFEPLTGYSRYGRHQQQRLDESPPPTPGLSASTRDLPEQERQERQEPPQPLRLPPRTPKPRTKKGGGSL